MSMGAMVAQMMDDLMRTLLGEITGLRINGDNETHGAGTDADV